MTELEAWKYIKQCYEDKLAGKHEPYEPENDEHRMVYSGICYATGALYARHEINWKDLELMRLRIDAKLEELNSWPYLAPYNEEGDSFRLTVLSEFIAELE